MMLTTPANNDDSSVEPEKQLEIHCRKGFRPAYHFNPPKKTG